MDKEHTRLVFRRPILVSGGRSPLDNANPHR